MWSGTTLLTQENVALRDGVKLWMERSLKKSRIDCCRSTTYICVLYNMYRNVYRAWDHILLFFVGVDW